MAIYTNYGRYLKAKQFKEMLESEGDTYMLFGLGNPKWDDDTSTQSLTVAPYNTEVINPDEDNINNNQFYDNHVQTWFHNIEAQSGGEDDDRPDDPISYSYSTIQAIKNSKANEENSIGSYMKKCFRLIPPFPCIWTGDVDETIISGTDSSNEPFNVTQSNYQDYFIIKSSANNSYRLCKDIDSTGNPIDSSAESYSIMRPSDKSIAIQYFTEMYIRGKALKNKLRAPVGLLGAVKCNVDFVKDIGGEGDKQYTGNIDQFWYGDRYWQIVRPDDTDIDNYIHDNITENATSHDKLYNNQEIYPHHLIFTATVNPRVLCEELSIDQYLVPRQIGIFTKKRKEGEEPGKLYYRAYENIFNFGQYNKDEADALQLVEADGNHDENEFYTVEHDDNNVDLTTVNGARFKHILNFTLPCKIREENETVVWETPDGEFKFLLNDYIRGQVRESHSIDRFGYVVGF